MSSIHDPLEERLKQIEARLNNLENRLPYDKLSPSQPVSEPPPPPLRNKEQRLSSLSEWIQQNWLAVTGIFLVLLAASWFVGYSFANNWISEKTRVEIAFIIGAIIYACGIFCIRSKSAGAQALVGSGEVLIVLAIYAGQALYHFIPIPEAFAGLAILTLFTAILSLLRSMEGLGFISILLAMLIPLMMTPEHPDYFFVLSYVLLIDLIAFIMFVACRWSTVFNIAWIMTIIYSPSVQSLSTPELMSIFITLFYLVFYIPSAYYATATDKSRYSLKLNFILLSSSATLALWVGSLDAIPWQLAFYLGAACISAYFGYRMSTLWPQMHNQDSRLISACILAFNAMLFAILTTIQLDHLLPFKLNVIYYLMVIPLVIAAARYIIKSPLTSIGFNLFYLLPIVQIAYDTHDLPSAPFNSMEFATICAAALSFGLAAYLIRNLEVAQIYKKIYEFITICLWTAAAVFLMILIWNICYNEIPNKIIGRGVAIVIYTLIAECCIFTGNREKLNFIRLGGLALILFVLLRLFIVEVWLMPVIIRTITFMVTGLLLLATAFFDKKRRSKTRI